MKGDDGTILRARVKAAESSAQRKEKLLERARLELAAADALVLAAERLIATSDEMAEEVEAVSRAAAEYRRQKTLSWTHTSGWQRRAINTPRGCQCGRHE